MLNISVSNEPDWYPVQTYLRHPALLPAPPVHAHLEHLWLLWIQIFLLYPDRWRQTWWFLLHCETAMTACRRKSPPAEPPRVLHSAHWQNQTLVPFQPVLISAGIHWHEPVATWPPGEPQTLCNPSPDGGRRRRRQDDDFLQHYDRPPQLATAPSGAAAQSRFGKESVMHVPSVLLKWSSSEMYSSHRLVVLVTGRLGILDFHFLVPNIDYWSIWLLITSSSSWSLFCIIINKYIYI